MFNEHKALAMGKKKKKNWIAGAIKHPGALHRELGVKQGAKIPAKRLAAAAKKGGKVGARARLAETLKGFHHKKDMKKKMKNDHDADDKKKKGMKCKKKHKHMKSCKLYDALAITRARTMGEFSFRAKSARR